MDTQGLTRGFAYSNIGAKINKSKPQELCKTEHYYQKESSRKSVFQQLQLLLVSFFGHLFHNKQKHSHAFPVHQPGQDVKMVETSPSVFSTRISTIWYFVTSSAKNLKSSIKIFQLRIGGFLYSLWANKRVRWGLILLLIAAPASKLIYLLLPINGFGDYFVNTRFLTIANFIETPVTNEWYFTTLYFWFWLCGELWAPLIAIYGIFLLFPKNYYPSYLVGIPFGYFFSLLIHRMFVTTYEEYHSGIGASLVATWIILGIAVFVLSDKLLFNKNHRKRSTEARIVGLINTPGISWEKKEKLLKEEAKEWMKNDNELFTRTG